MARSAADSTSVANHYAQRDLELVILNALAESGIDLARLNVNDLAPIDEFHIGGRKATLEFARQLDLDHSFKVLVSAVGSVVLPAAWLSSLVAR